MKHNMGTADRLVRVLVAVVILALFMNGNIHGLLSYVLLAIAAIFLLTSVFGTCPLYSLFGMKTCGTVNSKKP